MVCSNQFHRLHKNMMIDKKTVFAVVLVVISFGLLYHGVITRLVHDWLNDDNYSHGILIFPIACYFAWERKKQFLAEEISPAKTGIWVVLGSIAMLIAGILGAEMFLPRFSMLGVIVGSILFLFGWKHFKIMFFPIAFLILMIPIPAIIFNQIAFPLQLLASRFGEIALIACRIPVLREGNVIILANTSLEVADACSGIRSLISLLTLGIVYSYFSDSRIWIRVLMSLATIPIAIMTNGIRVAGTGIAAHFYGSEAAEGFFHTFSGWLVFIMAFILLFLLHRLIVWYASKGKSNITLAA
jgi:exosortase